MATELLTLKSMLLLFGGGDLYNFDEMASEMIFYKTMKKIFFPTYSVFEKSVYHLIVALP